MAAKKYPWERWSDGKVHGYQITGENAEEEVKRFRNSAYMHSKRHDQNIRTRLDPAEDGDGILIRFQMLPREREDQTFSEIFRDGMDGFEEVELTPEGEIAV